MKQLWMVLLLLPAVYAANTITNSETNIILEETLAIIHSDIILNLEDEVGNLTLILMPNAKDIKITINGQNKNCLVQSEFARCGNLTSGTHEIKLSYTSNYPIAQVGENTIFRHTDRLPYPADKQQVTLTLPVGYIIPREKGKEETFYTSPKPNEVYSDGQSIILNWEQKGQELPISTVMRKVIKAPIGWIASTIAAFLIAAITVTMYVLKERKPAVKAVKKKPAIIPSLIDNEQKIVNFLKETGEVWQKQIQQATGFSKAKVSRVIRNLEARGVITKTPYGNTNKIALKK